MKLLIVTQTLDSKHSVLGFFVRWVLEFAKQCEQVTVFCLDKGEDIFPENVSVIHIPRTWGGIKTWPLTLTYQALVQRKRYSHVFVHMNPEYILSAGIVWKVFRKKVSLWYAHGAVSMRLKVATAFVSNIFSSTPEGFRYKTLKLAIVGQGVDVSLYENVDTNRPFSNPTRMVSIGRISSSKRMEMLLETILEFKNIHKRNVMCTIIGGPATEQDTIYEKKLKEFIYTKEISDQVVWKGPLPLKEAIHILKTQDIFLHFGNTGSLDKAVLDAMMCGVIVCSSNEAVRSHIVNTYKDENVFISSSKDAAQKVVQLIDETDEKVIQLRNSGRVYVEENFSLKKLVKRIIQKM